MASRELGIVVEEFTDCAYYRQQMPLKGTVEIGGLQVDRHGTITGEGTYLTGYDFLPITKPLKPGALCRTGNLYVSVEPITTSR